MATKRFWGIVVLLALGGISVATGIIAHFTGVVSVKVLLFDIVIAGFGLYVLGSIFFDYPVTFKTTIKPTDNWAMRLFQAAIGLFMWGSTVWLLLKGYFHK